MRCLLIAALVPLSASFASIPYEAPVRPLVRAEMTRAVPEGLFLFRDTYQFDNAKHPMTGITPISPGPHKLIVLLSGQDDPALFDTEFGAHEWRSLSDAGSWRRPSPRTGTGWSSWRRQTTRISATAPRAPS